MTATAGRHYPHLAKAPIVEAMLDFRVRLPAEFDPSRLKALHSQLSAQYPILQEQQQIQEQIKHLPDRAPEFTVQNQGVVGYHFLSADQKNIVQFRRNGFTFNRLQPYTSWDDIFPEASRLWGLYAAEARPEEISRIAVRYINRLQLPVTNLKFEEYLTAAPAPPPSLPQHVSGFLSQLVMHDPQSSLAANIVQALEPRLNDAYITVILDIDVYQQDVSQLTPETALGPFAALREMKNRIFFGSITEKMLNLLQ